jgi:hypothetical protein
MINLNDIPKTYEEAVRNLAAWQGDDEITIFYLPDPAARVVRLVEISNSFGDNKELRPVAMGASPEFPFPSNVLLISTADWRRVKNGEKSLPAGWDPVQLKELDVRG